MFVPGIVFDAILVDFLTDDSFPEVEPWVRDWRAWPH